MKLSKKAVEFLHLSERDSFLLGESAIRQTFAVNDAPIFEPLIEFQKQFGGYTFYAGLAPIKFSLIKGSGGFPTSSQTAVIDFEESGKSEPQYFFDCASTKYQVQFFLDENGVYYEDYEATASSFGKVVEHLAIWAEIRKRPDFERLVDNQRIAAESVITNLNLQPISEASDQYTKWFSNEELYLTQYQGRTTVLGPKGYQQIMKQFFFSMLALMFFSCNSDVQNTSDQSLTVSDTSMIHTELISHIRLAINPKYQHWVLFSNGSYIILTDSLKGDPKSNALKIMKEYGPVHGGSPAGDISIKKLNKTQGWSVGGHYYGMYTYVHPDELIRAGIANPSDLDVGVYGRDKRDKDAKELRIVYINNE
jgi:hypothetical protein